MSDELKAGLERLYRDYLVDHGEPEDEADALNITGARRTRLIQIVSEMKYRAREALSVYKPLPNLAPLHESRCPERIVRGSNRGGKTVVAAVECARIVTGQDPFKKLPERDGRCWIVGKDGRHNSETIYRKLFRFGAFKVIEINGKLRAFNPLNPEHAKREKEAKPAPPLIPERFIKDIAWENKKESLPSLVTLTTGWEIRFCSSQGKPPQGMDVDYVWFDEEITDSQWYSEMAARLIDRNGLFLWSATAQHGGLQFFELHERAEQEKSKVRDQTIVEFFAHIDDNRAFSKAQRARFFNKLTEEERRIRIDGEFAFTSRLVYPEFSERVHGVPWFAIPDDWTRYAVIDPGRQVCAVLFAAVAPPNHPLARHVILYDELYIRGCDSMKFGKAMRDKTTGQSIYEFIIDSHGARVTDTGSGISIDAQYSAALKANGVKSQTTGYWFKPASSDIAGGIEAFRSWMIPRDDGSTRMLYFPSKMPNLTYEGTRYAYKFVRDKVTDKPEDKRDHLMDCGRYLAMRDPQWRKPKRKIKTPRGLLQRIEEKRKKNAPRGGINLGPGARAMS